MGILDKKVVLITGTGGGLGRVAARPLRERCKGCGCDIVLRSTTRRSNSYVAPAVR
jgi:NAD(P)-dependent dehydrogenase (short-subunit alcohol dehydrogenase family)